MRCKLTSSLTGYRRAGECKPPASQCFSSLLVPAFLLGWDRASALAYDCPWGHARRIDEFIFQLTDEILVVPPVQEGTEQWWME